MKKGLFVVFEGGEGSGKSTTLDTIFEWLNGKEVECIRTREPGGIKISEQIREVILDKENTEMDGRTEALLYAAARRQHLVEKVIPALNNGKVVLCDRFIDSSLAYQGHARGLGIDDIFKINMFAIDQYMPDIVILFDLDPKLGLERISKNKDREINRLDLEKIEFHNKVREGYSIISQKFSERVIKIDASKSKKEVAEDVKNILSSYIK